MDGKQSSSRSLGLLGFSGSVSPPFRAGSAHPARFLTGGTNLPESPFSMMEGGASIGSLQRKNGLHSLDQLGQFGHTLDKAAASNCPT